MDEQIVTTDLELAGFVLNIAKSQQEPHQLGGWLGFIIDLCKGNFYVPKEKVDDLKTSIRQAYVQSHVPCASQATG